MLVEHQKKENVSVQTKVTFEIECFIAQLKHSNVRVLKNVVCFDNILITFFRDRMRKKETLFGMACKLFKFHLVVRGYQYQKKYWQPIEGKTLDCMHEPKLERRHPRNHALSLPTTPTLPMPCTLFSRTYSSMFAVLVI